MRDYYASNSGRHTLNTCIRACFKQEGICYHVLLIGGRDEKMLLQSIFQVKFQDSGQLLTLKLEN